MSSMDVDSPAVVTIPVVVRHQGKKYDLDVDVSEIGMIFKFQIYSLTGVQPENQKTLIKGKLIKDDTELSSLGIKPGQTIMVMGQIGTAPTRLEAPAVRPKFIEDLSGVEVDSGNNQLVPCGLVNRSNTCYLNASLQAMRVFPELLDSLVNDFEDRPADTSLLLTRQLRRVYVQMASSNEPFSPDAFLMAIRMLHPLFAEMSAETGYAQQDAEEAWSFILDNLRQNFRVRDPEDEIGPSNWPCVSLIDRYLAGVMQKTLVCDEVEGRTDGPPLTSTESFMTLSCLINININHLRDGLLTAMTCKIRKTSEELGREAIYTCTSRIARLPRYLTMHLLRFYWKRLISKKTKILRKVTFPQELDASEFCTDELRAKMVPVRDKVREVRKEIEEIERTNKKRKRRLSEEHKAGASGSNSGSGSGSGSSTGTGAAKKDNDKGKGKKKADGAEVEFKTDAQIDAERREALETAKEELYQLVKPFLDDDPYCNHTGLYELRAVVAHHGANANFGHYTAFVKKGTVVDPNTGEMPEKDGNWWWFNDDRVTEVGSERIDALAGGGESHSALTLVYGAVPLPLPDSRKTEKFFHS